ncbi:MAG TPA: hypothetical protein DEP53_02290 [Bacteroidetes bacterium]|nr:hypothetical protein [Bacteroidota bacterium]
MKREEVDRLVHEKYLEMRRAMMGNCRSQASVEIDILENDRIGKLNEVDQFNPRANKTVLKFTKDELDHDYLIKGATYSHSEAE